MNSNLDENSVLAIVLAAGKGTRMKSELPKVMHEVNGQAMLYHVLQALTSANIDDVVLVLNEQIAPVVNQYLKNKNTRQNFSIALQLNQQGTADAVACAKVFFPEYKNIEYCQTRAYDDVGKKMTAKKYALILTGDAPAIESGVLKKFVTDTIEKKSDLSVLGIELPNPFGYGRILQDKSAQFLGIVEEKDADAEQKKIQLCNSGVICGKLDVLFNLLAQVKPKNAQGEYYLTDCFALAVESGKKVSIFKSSNWQDFMGINDREQLLQVEQWMKSRQLRNSQESI
ncbi:MAG: NTP transferase domain-containing protein [Oligoflexales bacterium]|nr:NTP transferase domain-containing protein [Oligoflexales bacterium]